MNESIYQELALHLDKLPDGFPPSPNGEHIHLLEMLFTPEQAKMSLNLSLEKQDVNTIATKAGMDTNETGRLLESMDQKGLLISSLSSKGDLLYRAAPLVVGIYEFQVKHLTPELIEAFHAYWSTAEDRPGFSTIPQMHTIPVNQSIDPHLESMPYEKVNEIVTSTSSFAVTTCICRHRAKMEGKGCQAPEESCLVFGDWADFYVRNGRGRSIDRDEVFEILAKADKANLVLQPSNSQKVEFICTCCGCCCGTLRGLKMHPKPAEAVASSFIAAFDETLCETCWTCIERCQMDALKEKGDRISFNKDRCIGCGLCVSTCPSGALTLTRKPLSNHLRVPPTFDDTWQIIVSEQKKTTTHPGL